MPCSRVCWSLLLGWALLLGRPAGGMKQRSPPSGTPAPEEGTEPPPSEEPEEPGEPQEEEQNWEERMEREADRLKRWMEESAAFNPFPVSSYEAIKALYRYNQDSWGPLFKRVEDTQVQVETTRVNMAYLEAEFVDTNCTLESMRESNATYTDSYLEQENCVPQNAGKRSRCTFGIYFGKGKGSEVVVGERCFRLH